jgi:NAD(P)-dependent dehydrogenase (short-subunit alcohol dehydrogenase family)
LRKQGRRNRPGPRHGPRTGAVRHPRELHRAWSHPDRHQCGKISDDKIEDFKRRTPLRRLGKPQDIANAFLYLASDMSDYVTGQVVDVNGGIFMN